MSTTTFKFLQKLRFFTRPSIFDKKLRFFTKTSIFYKNFDLYKNFDFLQRLRFFTKTYKGQLIRDKAIILKLVWDRALYNSTNC